MPTIILIRLNRGYGKILILTRDFMVGVNEEEIFCYYPYE